MHNEPSKSSLVPAAQYIRMSTEHQQYSTENQADAISEYARSHGFEIVATYADAGKSGLRIEGRDELRKMLTDVESGSAVFRTILVYDVSRWGRFQDCDESAFYEYTCKRAGIHVEYCMEQFKNDGSPASTIIKSVKRAMAGEYSRELSNKVFKGQCRLIQLGYRQGGPPGYGLRRMLIDVTGTPKGLLSRGEHKSLQTDRVVLVPGPEDEVKTVRTIYEMFVKQGKSEAQIAGLLNEARVPSGAERPWTRSAVHQILISEKYIGNNVYNRVSFKLKRTRVRNPADMWVRADGAFPALVDAESFFTARGIIQERNRAFSDDQMIDCLKTLLQAHANLTASLIDETDGAPSSSAFRSRFGSLLRAYRLAGFAPDRSYEFVEINRRLREGQPKLVSGMIRDLESIGATVDRATAASDLLVINGTYTASLYLCRCRATPAGRLRWQIQAPEGPCPDVSIFVRMDPANEQPSDFFLLPMRAMEVDELVLEPFNGAAIDTFRFQTLDFFLQMARVIEVEVAA